MNLYISTFFTLCVFNHAFKKITTLKFPKEFKRCHRNDPDIDECVRDAIQSAVPFLVNGMPDYGIVPVEPLLTTNITLIQEFGPVMANITLLQVLNRGTSKVTVLESHVDPANFKISSRLYFPHVTLEGTYSLKSKVFLFPVEGSGNFSMELGEIFSTAGLEGESELRSGVEYMKIKKAPIDLEINEISLDFKDLFNKDGRLGKNINWFLNRFANRIYKELKHVTEKTEEEIVIQLCQPFFDIVPYNELFL